MCGRRVKIATARRGVVRPPSVRASARFQGEASSVTVSFVDRTLTCRDCGREFLFTAGEEDFYQSRGLQNEPRRCPECRAARRHADGDRRADVMHDVICSDFGKQTRVACVPTAAPRGFSKTYFQLVG